MQLFVSKDFFIKKQNITIKEQRITNQLFKVIRAKPWYIFHIQNSLIRYEIQIENIKKDLILWKILSKNNLEIDNKIEISMLIALPNNYKKMEIIVQKLSEIWVNNIYFWEAERSIIKQISDQRLERLNLISIEAVEQSWGKLLPNIKVFSKNNIEKLIETIKKTTDLTFFVFFDKENNEKIDNKVLWDIEDLQNLKYLENLKNSKSLKNQIKEINIFGIIWPEWWLTIKDYDNFKILFNLENKKVFVKSLWKTILRTETASIIWWWYLRNLENYKNNII